MTVEQKIEPALTEWGEGWFRNVDGRPGPNDPRPFGEGEWVLGCFFDNEEGHSLCAMFDDTEATGHMVACFDLSEDDSRAIAASLLYGAKEHFSWAHVDAIRDVLPLIGTLSPLAAPLAEAADRIAALLPPREEPRP